MYNFVLSALIAYCLISALVWIFLGYYSDDLREREGRGLRLVERLLLSVFWIYFLVRYL